MKAAGNNADGLKVEATMRCQFLREAQVKWCRAIPQRKEIVRNSGLTLHERCTSGEWMACPTVKALREDCPSLTHCPFLQETLAQYCSAAGISKFIPYNEVTPSRCNTASHSYCQVFLTSTDPRVATRGTVSARMAVPKKKSLYFSPNHMWMHVHEDASIHIGVDALLAELLGSLEGVSFLTSSSLCYPTIAFFMGGTELRLTFPLKICQTGTNGSVVSHPSLIRSYPYSRGWLFEGSEEKHADDGCSPLDAGLMGQQHAAQWISDEKQYLERYVRDELVTMGATKMLTLMDGGTFRTDWTSFLSRKKLATLFYEFFSPAVFLPPVRTDFRA